MRTVLVVDDEPQLLRALQINLQAEGYRVLTALDGLSALNHAKTSAPDVIVLDLGLPDINGVDVIARIRRTSITPIIVLSARHGSVDKVRALDAGADDYVTKPFGLDELLARLRVAGRRLAPDVGAHGPTVDVGDFEVDLANRKVLRNGAAVRLTPREWAILELLVRNPGKLITQQQMLAKVWGPGYADETHYLRVYMGQLRRKLESDPARPKHLLTEAGMGYRFEP
ncbi:MULTISPECIES: response regulator [Paenarthrobacter]|uniref:Transcriptional regulatory protein KdpE n=1 Tax=Paenarthrobacter ureafaciens TaxID=37931 RepID=A0AAX3EL65_PAEUR|nr:MULTISPECIES: response regulator [Paenarthrobacter]NKR12987.1 DNA-binding response regulator [Arthrobacter sp. M5]NKR16806.1 DNA-binding response regulator [Arthrobacter sp. M6]OEH59808.1 DNA-binding response regulator [Arthrobacter sp. D4]OEH60047.1 DNA-binding response regulator [Arthrobacter sp. D2]MDO5862779.1 response regulator [Paenarthrobacter sp. SD-2]